MATEFVSRITPQNDPVGRMPAHEVAQSLEGIARGMVLIGHYLSEGRLKRKPPYSKNISFFLEPPRRGSWEAVYLAVINHPELLPFGALSANVAANLLTDALRYVFSRAVGGMAEPRTDQVKSLNEEKSGDIEAVVEAVEPGLLRAHTVIGNGASQILIVNGSNNIINFDWNSKDFMRSSRISPEDEFQEVSVSALNALERTGRVFIRSLQRTVPFKIDKHADRGTLPALSHSLNRYTSERDSDVELRFRRVVAPDGRVKRIIILGARIPGD